jgi:PAS domain-containing protein
VFHPFSPSSTAFALLMSGASVALAGSACGGENGSRPDSAFASGQGAQSDFRSLRARFFDADEKGRIALGDELSAFISRYPRDERSLTVRTYLAWALLERGDVKGARALLAPITAGPPGTQRDFALVTEAAVAVREGQAERGFRMLSELDGRVVDLDERFVYGEERARAAFAASAYAAAIHAMLDWIVQSPPDRRERARRRATEMLALFPMPELVRRLGGLRGEVQTENAELAAGVAWLERAILERLTRVALERSDADLARRVLEVAPAALRARPDGRKLLALVAVAPKAAAVSGRSVGVLLGLEDARARRRAAEVTAGMARALQRPSVGGAGVELLVREASGDARAALAALASDGAGVLVVGSSDATVRAAHEFAEFEHIPLIALRPAGIEPAADGFSFVLGIDDARVEALLAQALEARHGGRVERLGPGAAGCETEVAPGAPRFPLAAFKKAGTRSFLVTGDAECARALGAALGRNKADFGLGLALDAAFAYPDVGMPALVPHAGKFPDGSARSFYEALGHDAALLSERALAALPKEGTVSGARVDELHQRVRDALESAEAELVTSDARGFAGARTLPRELSVLDVSARSR